MSSITLKRFQSFDFAVGIGYLEVFVNPAQIAYVQPRRQSRADHHVLSGTLLYFQQDAGVLAVKEDIDHVIASLTSRGGTCKSCFQELPEAWMSLCNDCRNHRHNGVDEDYEAARADLDDDREPIQPGDYRYYETPRG